MKKKLQKYHYIQDWGTYTHQTVIFVGYNKQEILKILKKYKLLNRLRAELEKDEWDTNNYCFFCKEYDILSLKEWKNEWEFAEILAHEIHHLVFYVLGECQKMDNEREAQAYQFEYLLREIRKKLNQKFDKK